MNFWVYNIMGHEICMSIILIFLPFAVDKSLLEIPEDEIDHQRLSLKNLIRLAEHRELLAVFLFFWLNFHMRNYDAVSLNNLFIALSIIFFFQH